MKQIEKLIQNFKLKNQPIDTHLSIANLAFDSRKVTGDSMFFAINGTVVDGHKYIEQAIKNGAKAIVCETLPEILVDGVCYLQVEDSQEAMAYIAHQFYDCPSEQLKLVGVTGTNGKTTIASLLYQLFSNLGYKVGLLSTVKIMVADKEFATMHTTPDALTINEKLREMVDAGCTHAFMEVSSHGISQRRTDYLRYSGGIFTNLSHDHLDYHKDFADYRDVKKSFFDHLPADAFAISNQDDKNGVFMLQNTKAKKVFYAQRSVADVQVRILEQLPNATLLTINGKELWIQLVGAFNASNIAAIYAATHCLGIEDETLLPSLSLLKSVAGRFQLIENDNKYGIVDYAHTPDALENVLKTIDQLRKRKTQVITVVGCGGDRDKTKRPEMAKIAADLSDFVILTSDNPRTENPEHILDDMEKGIPTDFTQFVRITDREQAIKMACQMAKEEAIVLVAGKGHETYQEVNGKRHHFDDLELVKKYIKI